MHVHKMYKTGLQLQDTGICPPPSSMSPGCKTPSPLLPTLGDDGALKYEGITDKITTNHILRFSFFCFVFVPPYVDINTSLTDLHMKECRIVNNHLENTACHRAKKWQRMKSVIVTVATMVIYTSCQIN